MKTLLISLFFAGLLSAQYAPVPATQYPTLESILNAKPAIAKAAGVPASSCTVALDLYLNTTNGDLYVCYPINVWLKITGAGGAGGVWGSVTGTLANQADLVAALLAKVGTADARLTDARTPTAHAPSHATAGGDPVTPALIGAVPTSSANQPNGYLKLDGAGNAVVGAPVPATAPPAGSLNFQGNIYQNGVLFAGGAVSSVFGRTGAVLATAGDYNGFYAVLAHTHFIADIATLQTALDAKLTGAFNSNTATYLNGGGTFTVPAGGLPPTTVTVEQFGAIGDGVADDTAAIQAAINSIPAAGGTVLFAAKTYKTSSAISVSASNLNLLGHGMRASILQNTATTGDVLKFAGGGAGNCNTGGVFFSTVKGLGVKRTTPGVVGSTGVNVTNGCWVDIQDVESSDSVSSFYLATSANTLIQRTQAAWTTGSALTRYGYNIDANTADSSTRIKHGVVAATGGNITGLALSGYCIADLFVDDFETALADIGVSITSARNPATWSFCNGDIHLNHLVLDQSQVKGVLVNGVYGGGASNIAINDIFVDAPNAGGIGIDIEGSQGVSVNGGQLRSRGAGGIGVMIAGANSGNNRVIGVKVDTTPTSILLSGTSNNVVTGSTFSSIASLPTTTHISLIGATNNAITGNVLSGYATTGITLDAASSANKVYPNAIDPLHITTGITNLGAGNDTGGWTVSSCQPGLGDGLNAIPAGTYLQTGCLNDTGVALTVTGIKCLSDNAGTSAMNVTNGAGTSLLSGPITCSAAFAVGTQSATVTIAAGDFLKFAFVSDGATKQTTWTVTESR